MSRSCEHERNVQAALSRFCAANGLTRRDFLQLFGAAGAAALGGRIVPEPVHAYTAEGPGDFRPRYASREPSGTVTTMEGATPNNLDPALRNAVPEFTVNGHVYDMFLGRDPKTLQIVPNI